MIVLFVGGCAGEQTERDPFTDLPHVEFTEVVEITDDPSHDLYFDSHAFRDVAVGADGAVFASNYMQAFVFRFDAEGTYQETIGEEGQGPGEFEHTPGLTLSANGDTLYARGRFNGRSVGVFERAESGFAYVRTMMLPEHERHQPRTIYAVGADRLAVEYRLSPPPKSKRLRLRCNDNSRRNCRQGYALEVPRRCRMAV